MPVLKRKKKKGKKGKKGFPSSSCRRRNFAKRKREGEKKGEKRQKSTMENDGDGFFTYKISQVSRRG